MFNQRNNGPFGRNSGMFGSSRFQYQTLPYGYEGVQTSGLMSKVMGLLAFSFIFAAIGTFVGFFHIGDYLFFGLILLLVTSLAGLFFGGLFHTTIFQLIFSLFGIALFSGFVIFHVQRAKYMADTMPNAIGLTISIFLAVLNLFLFILELLSILQGGRRR